MSKGDVLMEYVDTPFDITVWDNGGEKPPKQGTHDRYAIIFPDGAVYVMSAFPYYDGVCYYYGQSYKPTSEDVNRTKIPYQVLNKIEELKL